jgi:hypothetical protein
MLLTSKQELGTPVSRRPSVADRTANPELTRQMAVEKGGGTVVAIAVNSRPVIRNRGGWTAESGRASGGAGTDVAWRGAKESPQLSAHVKSRPNVNEAAASNAPQLPICRSCRRREDDGERCGGENAARPSVQSREAFSQSRYMIKARRERRSSARERWGTTAAFAPIIGTTQRRSGLAFRRR